MKIFNFIKYSLILSIIISVIIVFIEGFLSFYFSSNYFYQKDKLSTYKKNEIFSKDSYFIDPYNKQKKTTGRTLSNRYTVSMNGRWAPNTLARKYDYDDYVKGKGEGLFTDNYGFVHNGNPDRELFQQDFYNIIFIGGSTAEGANTTSSNENTIAAHIEKILRKKNNKINVINAGKSGYKTFDEFLMSYNLFGKFNIQEIIFFNGNNDMLSQSYSEKLKWNYFDEIINYQEQYQFLFSQRYTLKIKYYINRLKQKILNLKTLKSSYKAPPREFLVNIFQKEFDTYESKKEDENFELIVKNYIYNLRLSNSFCVEFKIKCSFFLQPHIGEKNLKHQYEKEYFSKVKFKNYDLMKKKWYRTSSKLMESIAEEKKIDFYDISKIFVDDQSLVHLDLGHYSDYGNKIIAENIAKNLLLIRDFK